MSTATATKTAATTMLDLALEYVRKGQRVFPARPADQPGFDRDGNPTVFKVKSPLNDKGHNGAATREHVIRRWWSDWPDALVGTPIGPEMGAFVLDVDVKPGVGSGFDWLDEMQAAHGPLPETKTVRTPRGGSHFYFRHVEGVGTSPGTISSPLVDVRGGGRGYAIAAGSVMADGRRYELVNDAPIADAPQWLLDLILVERPDRPAAPSKPYSGEDSVYAVTALEGEVAKLVGMSAPGRGYQRNSSAYRIGQLVGGGEIDQGRVEREIYAACERNGLVSTDGSRETMRDIRRAVRDGMRQPRTAPESSSATLAADGARLASLIVTDASRMPSEAANDDDKAVPIPRPKEGWPGIFSSGEFVRGFTPPDYLIDGIVQLGFVYSVTASTGAGKTALLLLLSALTALAQPMGDREVRQGKVLYLAGENPDDIRMRWLATAHHMAFNVEDIDVHFIPGRFAIPKLISEVRKAATALGGVDLVVVDTSAAFFGGDDENANAEMGRHARDLRTLTTLAGSPCVLVACHPTKNADQGNLLPRGGGSFIAEMDGNLVCVKSDAGVKLHWHGKHRGPDFKPVMFDLSTVTAPELKDSRGRDIPTVLASVISDGEVIGRRLVARRDEDEVLIAVENNGPVSASRVAELAGWLTEGGEPHKRRAQTALDRLRRDKLVKLDRDGWRLAKAGHDAAQVARGDLHWKSVTERSVANLTAKKRRTEDRTEPVR